MPTCVYPSFSDISIEKKTTATNQPTNTHPTDITNQHPTWWTALRWTDQHFALFLLPLFLFFLPCFRVCSFPVGDPGCVLFSLPKMLQKKKTEELQMCIFGSRTMNNTNISSKRSTANFGPSLSDPHLSGAATFFVIQLLFFSMQCLWERFFQEK